ncbi:MAG: hypothetical protein JO132_15010 [Streptosporangiaceae bacterium]|nr:hypothetical protein [Streptosporangiaceae bacterium]
MPLFPPARSAARGNQGAVRIPTVSCLPQGAGCDTISSSSGGAVSVKGIKAVDSAEHTANPNKDVEPPDQGLCAGNGSVVETNNIGEILIFNAALKRVSPVISLDRIMGLTSRNWSSGGDPSCLYDSSNGGHWFFTEIVSASPESAGGPFAGCFAAVANTCYEGIAVSKGSSPFGPYNVYYLNANYNPSEPGNPYQLNDFAKIGASRDAFLLFYDEFPLKGNGIGGGAFNGAQEFAFNKTALETGQPVANVAVARENMGLLPTPNGTCARDNKYHLPGITCWFSVIPAAPSDAAQWNNTHGGSAFMLGTLDYYSLSDNRLAAWYWTGLKGLNSSGCSACSGIRFGGQLFTGVLRYYNNNSLPSGILASQKAGPIPLGDECGKAGLSTTVKHCPENGIATNGDNITQAAQAQGQLWAGANTALTQTYTSSQEQHMGAVYWVVGTGSFGFNGLLSLTSQGYVSPMHEDIEFPALAAPDTGPAVISFSLNGNGGPTGADNGGYYPSSAFGRVTSRSGGLLSSTINIAALGQSPQDGFTEYQGYPGPTRPRWGDYGAAVAMGGKVYFASEYIQYPNCLPPEFTLTIGTCGGTRDGFANWGTSVNYVTP